MSTMSPIRPSCCPHQSSPEAASPPRSSSSINARTVRKRKSSPLSLHDSTLGIPLFRLARLLALLDLSNHSFESLADILVVARAGLGEAAAQLFGELLAVCEGDLALLRAQIRFVAYNCEGDCVGALDGIVSWYSTCWKGWVGHALQLVRDRCNAQCALLANGMQ